MLSVWQAVKVDSGMTDEINNHVSCTRICGKGPNTSSEKEKDTVHDCTLVGNHSKSDLEKIKTLLDSKGKILSQTALTALIRKRNELVKLFNGFILMTRLFVLYIHSQ